MDLIGKVALCAALVAAEALGTEVNFARGKWNADDWTLVKSPRWDYCHGFTQKDGWIENETPDVSAEEVYRKFCAKSYSGMVLKEKAKLGQTISTTTGWDWLMAPLIVIAPELGVAKDGKTAEFRDHWEIVVYNQGINVWHHFWSPEKGPSHFKAAALTLPEREYFKPNEKHTLTVKVQKNRKNRKEMICTCGGYTLQYDDDSLPDEFYAGIIGCEGRNFFWDFSVDSAK